MSSQLSFSPNTTTKRAHTDRLSVAAQINQGYAVSCCVLSFLLSLLVVFLHTRPVLSSVIQGTKVEGGITFLLLSFWSALVSIVSDTRHGLATDASGSITNGNLYYFSWAGLAVGVALALSYIRSVWGIDVTAELQNRARRLQYWVSLAIFGLVQMGSSARLYDNHCGRANVGLGEAELGSVRFCSRCKFGVVLGILSAVLSATVAGLKMGTTNSGKVSWLFTMEMVVSAVMVVSQAIGVAFLTSCQGPGAPLNNLFYSSWGAFGMVLVLAASCFDDFSAASGALKSDAIQRDSFSGTDGERSGLRDGLS